MFAHGRELHLKPPLATGKASHLVMQGDANGHRMSRPMVVTTLACGKDATESLTLRTHGYIEQKGEIYLSCERRVGVLNCEKKKQTKKTLQMSPDMAQRPIEIVTLTQKFRVKEGRAQYISSALWK